LHVQYGTVTVTTSATALLKSLKEWYYNVAVFEASATYIINQ